MARRFLISPDAWGDETVSLNEKELYHARRVLRLEPGECVIVFDGEGREAQAQVESLRRTEGILKLLSQPALKNANKLTIVLGQGLPKGRKIEAIIEDATELGATSIVPLQCKRSVVKIHPNKMADRVERWTRIAASAAKQCGRADIPKISPPTGVAEFLESAQSSNPLILMAWEVADSAEKSHNLTHILQGEKPESVWLMIGPEGGFTQEEAALAAEKGAHIVSLGPRILRTETAGPALLTLVQHILGDMG